MAGYQINSFASGNIKYKDSNGVSHNVSEIWYKDTIGHYSPFWPNKYWASDIVVENISNHINYNYSVSNNVPSYQRVDNNQTFSALLPGTYVIKGSINYGDNSNLTETNAYFHHNTLSGGVSCWSAESNNDLYRDANKYTGELEHYGVYTANEDVISNTSTNVELGYSVPGTQATISVGTNYASVNFVNVTPVILKRIAIEQELKLYDENNNLLVGGNQLDIHPGDTVRIYTKLDKTGETGSGYSDTTDAKTTEYRLVTTHLALAVATVNQQHGYIDITGNSIGSGYLEFSCDNNGDGNIDQQITIYINVMHSADYRLKWGNNLIDTTTGITISSVGNLVVEKSTNYTDNNPTWVIDNTTCNISSSDTSVITVNGKELTPVSSGNSTITVTVDWKTFVFTVTVPQQVQLSFGYGPFNGSSISYVGGASQLNNNSIASWSPNSNSTLGIKFATDSSLSTGRTVYFDGGSELDTNNNLTVYVSEISTGVFTFMFGGAVPQSGQDVLELDVYSDASCNDQIGTITITINF